MATQSEINDFVEQIMPYFNPAPVEDDAVEVAFPRVDRGMSDAEDMKRMRAFGVAIVDEPGDGAPFILLSRDNASNTVTVGSSAPSGESVATVNGVTHILRQPKTLHLPMPTSRTRYRIGSLYDPVAAETSGRPVELAVWDASVPLGQGKIGLGHLDIIREPNQLLTDAQVIVTRRQVSPTMVVDDRENLSNSDNLLWGTRALVWRTGEELLFRGQWHSLSNPEWRPLALSSQYTSALAPAEYRLMPDGCAEFRGGVKRANGAQLTNSGNLIYFGNVPDVEWSRVTTSPVATTGGRNNVRVETTSGGLGNRELSYMVDPGSGSAYWLSLDGFRAWVK